MRIGQATDIHQLVENRDLILGGVKIPYEKGLLGHSDADVLTHAIAESILGALALGDLGKHFPDTDDKYKNANSLDLLAEVVRMMQEKDYEIVNVDSTILLEKPKLVTYKQQMEVNIAKVLQTAVENVNVKATRGEKMGFIGRSEGIMAQAVVLIEKRK